MKLREINTKLEVELKEARELEKSHRYHLLASREMIGNLQESVSQLVYLKRDIKKLSEEVLNKDSSISILQKVSTKLMHVGIGYSIIILGLGELYYLLFSTM